MVQVKVETASQLAVKPLRKPFPLLLADLPVAS
jgi:hypothetical protein